MLQMLATSRVSSGGANATAETLAEAKLMLREADTNGDGRISREEFYSLLRDNHAPDSLSFYDDRCVCTVQYCTCADIYIVGKLRMD